MHSLCLLARNALDHRLTPPAQTRKLLARWPALVLRVHLVDDPYQLPNHDLVFPRVMRLLHILDRVHDATRPGLLAEAAHRLAHRRSHVSSGTPRTDSRADTFTDFRGSSTSDPDRDDDPPREDKTHDEVSATSLRQRLQPGLTVASRILTSVEPIPSDLRTSTSLLK